MEEMCLFSCFLKMGKDSAARIEFRRSFHQEGTINEKVRESDFVPLWDGTIMRIQCTEWCAWSNTESQRTGIGAP